MNIDKSKRLVILDFSGELYNLLKDEYSIIKHTNDMKDVVDYDYSYDYLVCEAYYQDGDIFELIKHIQTKPLLFDNLSNKMVQKLKNKVEFVSKENFFILNDYIDIAIDTKGYDLVIKAIKMFLEDESLILEVGPLYELLGDNSEKLIRYYKEKLIDSGKLKYNGEFNRTYPTNTEFFNIIYSLYKAKKIKV